MPDMTDAQWRAFLLERPRTAKVATTRADGRPHYLSDDLAELRPTRVVAESGMTDS
jgi:hypothetical protein